MFFSPTVNFFGSYLLEYSLAYFSFLVKRGEMLVENVFLVHLHFFGSFLLTESLFHLLFLVKRGEMLVAHILLADLPVLLLIST